MTQKIYKTAQGKTIDMGQLMLENEQVRAVGNMGVNARGDLLDGANRVIESKPKQVQRQYARQVSAHSAKLPVAAGTRAVREKLSEIDTTPIEPVTPASLEGIAFSSEPMVLQEPAPVTQDDPVVETPLRGGLAAAIARSRTVEQTRLKTPRQQAQDTPGVKKL